MGASEFVNHWVNTRSKVQLRAIVAEIAERAEMGTGPDNCRALYATDLEEIFLEQGVAEVDS